MTSPHAPTVWPPDVQTLSIDVGGTGLKAAILDSVGQMVTERVKIETPYPCPPPQLVESLTGLVRDLGIFHRASVGFPGLVRDGRVVEVPSLSRAEYGGKADPDLVAQWHGFDLSTSLADALAVPVRVANDAGVAERLTGGGAIVVTSKSPEEYAQFMRVQTEFWAKLVKQTGAAAE